MSAKLIAVYDKKMQALINCIAKANMAMVMAPRPTSSSTAAAASSATTGTSSLEEVVEEKGSGSDWDDGEQSGWKIPMEACR
eukprot:3614273-Pleurochrysis_carterae.AAC.1